MYIFRQDIKKLENSCCSLRKVIEHDALQNQGMYTYKMTIPISSFVNVFGYITAKA